MSAELKYGSYTHVGHWSVAVSKVRRFDPTTLKYTGYITTWTITGTLLKTDATTILSHVGNLKDAYNAGATLLLTLKDASGGNTLETMTGSLTEQGRFTIDGPNFPVGGGPEWATKRTYVITVTGTFATLTAWEYVSRYVLQQSGKQLVTHTGTYYKAASGALDSYISGYATEFDLVDATWIRTRNTYNANDADTQVVFTIEHAEGWLALPTDVTSGSYTRNIAQIAGGMSILTLSGRFQGTGAQAAIDALKDSSKPCLEENVTEDPYDGSLSFNLRYINNDEDLLEFDEMVIIGKALQRSVFFEVLDGGLPVEQKTTLKPATASQIGRAVYKTSAADPVPYWSDDGMQDHSIEKGKVKTDVNEGLLTQSIRWRFSWMFSQTPVFPL